MSHELEIVDGVAKIAYAGETPWHHLGTKVEDDLTPQEMMKAAGLDWTVSKVPSYVKIEGQEIWTGDSALVRSSDNSILDMISNDWNPCQNEEAFEFFTDFVKNGDMKMEVAGALRNGQMVWGLAKVGSDFTIFGKDKVESYLLFSNPHKYGQSINVGFTAVRVVCNNTLSLALNTSSKQMAKVSHRKAFNSEEVKEILGLANLKLDKYKEIAEYIGSVRYTPETLEQYFSNVFPFNRKKEEGSKVLSMNAKRALEIVDTQPGAEYAPGTFWTAFNAVTYMVDHTMGRSDDSRLYSSWYGSNKALKVDALQQAVEMAQAA